MIKINKCVYSSKNKSYAPDETITFYLDCDNYYQNIFRIMLIEYPDSYSFDNFEMIENTTNIEDELLIHRIKMTPVDSGKVNDASRFVIKVEHPLKSKDPVKHILSDDIKPFAAGCKGILLASISAGTKLHLNFGLSKNHGTPQYFPVATPISNPEEKKIVLQSVGSVPFKNLVLSAVQNFYIDVYDCIKKLKSGMVLTAGGATIIQISDCNEYILRFICVFIQDRYPEIPYVEVKRVTYINRDLKWKIFMKSGIDKILNEVQIALKKEEKTLVKNIEKVM
ncbi:MAG: hypothetical protein ACOCRK_01170 [bacterium]